MTAVPTDPLEGLKLVMASPPVDCRVMLVMFPAASYVYWMTLLAANEAVANTIPARKERITRTAAATWTCLRQAPAKDLPENKTNPRLVACSPLDVSSRRHVVTRIFLVGDDSALRANRIPPVQVGVNTFLLSPCDDATEVCANSAARNLAAEAGFGCEALHRN